MRTAQQIKKELAEAKAAERVARVEAEAICRRREAAMGRVLALKAELAAAQEMRR